MLESSSREPECLDQQVDELLGQLTPDIATWQALCKRFSVDLFCGLFMGSENEGLTISPASLAALGRRGIEVSLDVYALF